MLEIHYYFTPILDHLESFDKNDWHLYPIVNLATAKRFRDAAGLPRNVEHLNAVFDRLQKISLDYLTINLYGRKYGRRFLLNLQDTLSADQLLTYNNLIRQQILQKIGLSISDFKIFHKFSKSELKNGLQDFYENHFKQCPASFVLTKTEALQINACEHKLLQNYLIEIEKTA